MVDLRPGLASLSEHQVTPRHHRVGHALACCEHGLVPVAFRVAIEGMEQPAHKRPTINALVGSHKVGEGREDNGLELGVFGGIQSEW